MSHVFFFLPTICEVNPSPFPAEQFDFACHGIDLSYLEKMMVKYCNAMSCLIKSKNIL